MILWPSYKYTTVASESPAFVTIFLILRLLDSAPRAMHAVAARRARAAGVPCQGSNSAVWTVTAASSSLAWTLTRRFQASRGANRAMYHYSSPSRRM